jgi:hypothetical protein
VNQRSVSFAVLAIALFLLLGIWYVRTRRTQEVDASSSNTPKTADRKDPEPPRMVPPIAPTAKPEAPEVPPDPAAYLAGELLVRVLSTDNQPIAGANIYPYLQEGSLEQEGVLELPPADARGITHLEGKTPAFSHNRITSTDGTALLKVAIPRKTRYLDSIIGLLVEASGTVGRHNKGWLRLPKEGERKEITFHLQAGNAIHGHILNLQDDDHEFLFVKLCPPSEEKAEGKERTWFDVPTTSAQGTFTSTVAPPGPILLVISHYRGKYRPYRQVLYPPFPKVVEVMLEVNPDHNESGRVIYTITNPPPGAKGLSHCIRAYSKDNRTMVGGTNIHDSLEPEKDFLRGGSYQALLMCCEQKSYWATAHFTVVDGGTTEVPLTLEPAGAVRLHVRDKSLGRFPGGDGWSVYVHYKFGENYGALAGQTLGWGKTKTPTEGEFLFVNMPPGSLKLVVTGKVTGNRYKGASTLTLAPGEEQSLEVLVDEAKPGKD